MGGAAEARHPEGVADEAERILAEIADVPRGGLAHRTLRTAGVTIDAWFSDPAYAELCERNVASSPEHEGPRMTLLAVDATSLGRRAPALPPGLFTRRAFNEALASRGLRGHVSPDSPMWQLYSPTRRLGIQFCSRPGGTPAWESGSPLRHFIHWGMSGERRLAHAGTLGRSGRGVLLAGNGGAGKSGTTLAGIAAGLETVGDDYVILAADERRFVARPIFRVLKQDPEGFRRVFGPDAAPPDAPVNWQGKWEIHASALPPSAAVDRLDIRAVVLPRLAGAARSELRRVPGGQAMRALLPSNILQLPDGENDGIRFIAELSRSVPAYELALSTDSREIAATLSSFIDGLP